MVVDYREKVMAFVHANGPVLPVQIAKEVSTSILMASAMLSELSSKGSLRVSSLKVGGSPLYYAPGQETMLLKFTQHMNEKDRRTIELLQNMKVVRDIEQEALTRVSLRGIKDFAYPLNVTHNGITEIFWKWAQLTDAEATGFIKQMLTPPAPIQQPLQSPAPVQPKQAPIKPAPARVARAPVQTEPVAQVIQPEPAFVERRVAKRKYARATIAPAQPAPIAAPIPTPIPLTPQAEDPALSDPFFHQLQAFCAKGNIKILQHQMLKKKQDYDLVLEIPSPVGSLVYYAKARNKQKLTDADLSAAFVQGQIKKLPALLLAPGELSKKGQDLLASDLRGIAFTRLI